MAEWAGDVLARQLRAATEVVRRHVPPTPQYAWPLLGRACRRRGVGEAREPHAHRRVQGARRPGVRRPAAARAAARARAGQRHSRQPRAEHRPRRSRRAASPVTIVVPHGNSPDKNAAMRAWGAELIEHGHDFQAAREHAGRWPPSGASRWCRRSTPISCSAWPPTPSSCSTAVAATSTPCTCRSAWARASAG